MERPLHIRSLATRGLGLKRRHEDDGVDEGESLATRGRGLKRKGWNGKGQWVVVARHTRAWIETFCDL